MRPVLVLVTGLPGVGKSTFASSVADEFRAAVIAHDWVMAGLRANADVWSTLRRLDWIEFRTVGWSVMWNVAQSQLREGRSVILDGVAREPEIAATRERAEAEGAQAIVVLCELEDEHTHRVRVEGRTRAITGWPELTWNEVSRSRENWERPTDFDILVDCSKSLRDNQKDFLERLPFA